jgi:hypothetical protein
MNPKVVLFTFLMFGSLVVGSQVARATEVFISRHLKVHPRWHYPVGVADRIQKATEEERIAF